MTTFGGKGLVTSPILPTSFSLLRDGNRRERVLFTDDQFLMLMRDVALDFALVDEIGKETLALLGVNVVGRLDGSKCRHKG